MQVEQLDQRAIELGHHVQIILKEFQNVHCSAANSPHVGVNHQEMRVIQFLNATGSQIMRSVADHLSLAVNSVTSIVDGLEQKELVIRNRSNADRRVILVELTEAGEQIGKAVDAAKLELYRSMLSPLSSNEQVQFLSLFRKIAQGVSQAEAVESV